MSTLEIDQIKFGVMLTNECERDIQLELNRNYLKSFPARLKFCHIVSVLANGVLFCHKLRSAIKKKSPTKINFKLKLKLINVFIFSFWEPYRLDY